MCLKEHLDLVADDYKGPMKAVMRNRVINPLYETKVIAHPATYDAYGLKTSDARTETVLTPKQLTGDELQRVRSEIRTEARQYSKSPLGSEQQIGRALQDANTLIGESLEKQHPEVVVHSSNLQCCYPRAI